MKKFIYVNNSIKLIIEEDIVGFYLYVFTDKSKFNVPTQDYLLDSLNMAFEEAEEKFGVSRSAWKEEQNY